MMSGFFKFPRTPYLTSSQGERSLSQGEMEEFLRHEIVVEEKIDGSNLGISFSEDGEPMLQKRGSYIKYWPGLDEWLESRLDILFDNLLDRYILFGEWCYAKHSIYYDRLPDWFLGFDIYDKVEKRFFSTERRDNLLDKMNIHKVPFIAKGIFTLEELKKMITISKVGSRLMEGLYLRIDSERWLRERAKIVRPGFVQRDICWSGTKIEKNKIAEQRR